MAPRAVTSVAVVRHATSLRYWKKLRPYEGAKISARSVPVYDGVKVHHMLLPLLAGSLISLAAMVLSRSSVVHGVPGVIPVTSVAEATKSLAGPRTTLIRNGMSVVPDTRILYERPPRALKEIPLAERELPPCEAYGVPMEATGAVGAVSQMS